MSQDVRRPKAETEADFVERKNAKDLGTRVDRVTAGHEESSMKKGIQGVTEKIEKAAHNIKEAVMGSENEKKMQPRMQDSENSGMRKAGEEAKKMMNKIQDGENSGMKKAGEEAKKMMNKMQDSENSAIRKVGDEAKKMSNKMEKENMKMPEMDWEESYKSAESDIRKSLKQGNSDLSSQLEKVYQGMLKNCLKQSDDEPHKLQKCWDEFSTKMQPVYQKLQERSAESTESLKKCFESKQNAKDCIEEGIKFGQASLSDATNSIKAYLA